MIYDKDDFEVKYWGGDWVSFNDEFKSPKASKRSIKKRLLITICFVLIIGLTPALVYGISNLSFKSSKTVTAVNPDAIEKKTVNQNSVDYKEPTPSISKNGVQTVEIINNDSYWKIAKRVCGTGKNYLSVRDQNAGKALHTGDTVVVNCST